MNKLLLILLCLCLCQGCSRLVNEVPNREFKVFEYNRIGFGGKAHIRALNSVRKGNHLFIERVEIEEITPVISVSIILEEVSREYLINQ